MTAAPALARGAYGLALCAAPGAVLGLADALVALAFGADALARLP